METKNIQIKHKTSGGYVILHPETDAAQILNLESKVKSFQDNRIFPVGFELITEKHPFYVNYLLEYRTGVSVHCDRSLSDIISHIKGRAADGNTSDYPDRCALVGFVEDLNERVVEGYLYNGNFYEDIAHTEEITLREGVVYVDLTAGQSRSSYRFQKARYEKFPAEYGDTDGYYNPEDGNFYEDEDFTLLIVPGENVIYTDLSTGDRYAYMNDCLLRCQCEDDFLSIGHIQIPGLVFRSGGISDTVKFQTLHSNSEITIIGTYFPNGIPDTDFWAANINMCKYQDVNGMVQEIPDKTSPELYPSIEAVKKYSSKSLGLEYRNDGTKTGTANLTFSEKLRNYVLIDTSDDLGISITSNNDAENYILIHNTGSSSINITFSALYHGQTPIADVIIPDDGVEISAGSYCELSLFVGSSIAVITASGELS